MADPGETRTELRAISDSEAGALLQMLIAVQYIDPNQNGLRTSDMLKIAKMSDISYAADAATMLRDAIETVCGRSIEKVNPQPLGNRLSHFRNRVVGQLAFDFTVKSGINYWFVQYCSGPEVPGGPDSANL